MLLRLTGSRAPGSARPSAAFAMVLAWLIAVLLAFVPLAGVSSADEGPGAEETSAPPEPEPIPTETPTPEPADVAPEPTAEPAEETSEESEPAEEPAEEPSEEPAEDSSEEPGPTEEPTAEPTEGPTEESTAEPSEEPTEEPTVEPSEEPSVEPTEEPLAEPSEEPTVEPSEEPTPEPSDEPELDEDADAESGLEDLLAAAQVSECTEIEDGVRCEDADGTVCTYFDDGRVECDDDPEASLQTECYEEGDDFICVYEDGSSCTWFANGDYECRDPQGNVTQYCITHANGDEECGVTGSYVCTYYAAGGYRCDYENGSSDECTYDGDVQVCTYTQADGSYCTYRYGDTSYYSNWECYDSNGQLTHSWQCSEDGDTLTCNEFWLGSNGSYCEYTTTRVSGTWVHWRYTCYDSSGDLSFEDECAREGDDLVCTYTESDHSYCIYRYFDWYGDSPYSYEVDCFDSNGNLVSSCQYSQEGGWQCEGQEVGEPIAPAPPTGVTATAGDGQITVSWNAVSSTSDAPVEGYHIYRDEVPVHTVESAFTTSWIDTGVENGVTYTYWVTAYGPGGESDFSQSASATPVALPPTPTGVTATAGNGQVVVSWTPPVTISQTGTIDGYRIYRDNALVFTLADPGASSWTNTGLTNGTTYSYQVASYGEGGESPRSTAVTATPIGPPPAPTGVTATPGNGQVTVSWNAVASTAAAPVTGYHIYRNGSAEPTDTVSGLTSWVDTGRTNGVSYTYRVSAFGSGGESPLSGAVAATPVGPPPEPTGLHATSGVGQITVSWTPVAGTTAAPLDGYRVYRDGVVIQQIADPMADSWTDTNVVGGTVYLYSVASYGPGGESPRNSSVSIGSPTGVPATPSGVTVSPGIGLVVVGWSPVLPASFLAHTGPVDGYRVYRDNVLVQQIADPSAHSWIDTGLAGGTTYSYQVASYGPGGESPRSSAVTTTTTYGPPATPTGLGATPGNGQVTISWSAVASTSSRPVTGYRIYRDGVLAQDVTGATTTSWTDTGRTNGSTYSYRVAAYGVGGQSAQSAAVTATPSAPAPGTPPAPTGVSAAVQAGGVLVTWVPVPSTEAAPVSGYRIFRDGVLVHEIEDPTASSWLDTTATFSAVSASRWATSHTTSHTYEVVSFGPGGQSPSSTAVVDTTTEPTEPTEPTGPVIPPDHNPDDPGTATASPSTVTVPSGGTFIVEGDGWLPGSVVTIEIFSAPVLLGTANVDENGRFRTQVSLPSGFPPGNHTLVMSGLDLDGLPRRVSVPMTVFAIGAMADEPRRADSVSRTAVRASASSTGPGPLAATGAPAGALLCVALLMLGTGVAAVNTGRRRSRRLV